MLDMQLMQFFLIFGCKRHEHSETVKLYIYDTSLSVIYDFGQNLEKSSGVLMVRFVKKSTFVLLTV